MNRQNFLGHLALAITLILLAAFLGQIRHWQQEWRSNHAYWAVGDRRPVTSKPRTAEVIVKFRAGTSLEQMKAIAARFGDRLEDQYEFIDGEAVMEDLDGESAEQVAAEYNAHTDLVEYAEPNYEISLDPTEAQNYRGFGGNTGEQNSDAALSDPMFSEQWSLENTGQRGGRAQADISAVDAWAKTHGSDETVVAVLDSGVDYTHQDLANNIWTRPANVAAYTDAQLGTVDDLHGFNAVTNSGDPMDDNGHGTHVAGIIGAEGDNEIGIAGINWTVKIMPLKFMSAGGYGTTRDAIKAINYVIERKRDGVNVRVINASWGSTQNSRALRDAIKKAGDEGILFVAASGNSSANADRNPHYPAGYKLPNVISVAATDRNDQLASFSNYGAKSVHIAAPGVEILSTWLDNQFREASGTSMATPEVAGVAALIVATNPNISVENLRERILNSVDRLDSLNGKVSTGGRLNAAKAVGAQ